MAHTTYARRRKRANKPSPSPDLPKRARGRPPKHTSANRNLPTVTPPRQPQRITRSTAPTTPSPSQSRSRQIPSHRTTRATSRPIRSEASKNRELYVAVPSSPTKPGPKFNWLQTKARYKLRIKHAQEGREMYKRMWFHSLAESAADTTIDRSILPSANVIHPNVDRLQQVVSKFVRENPNHAVVQSINRMASGRTPNKDANIDQLKQSMRALVDFHLKRMVEEDKTDCVAEILFNESLFDDAVRMPSAV